MKSVSIFLVEDEALIRMMLVQMLEELGHRVVAEAGSIHEAEPLARTSLFDLAIFDIKRQSLRREACPSYLSVAMGRRVGRSCSATRPYFGSHS